MATPAMEEPISAEAMIETPPEDPAPTAQSDGAGSMADVQPIPVMDPDADGRLDLPAPTPGGRTRAGGLGRLHECGGPSLRSVRHGRPRRILGRTTAPTPTDPAPTGRLTNPMPRRHPARPLYTPQASSTALASLNERRRTATAPRWP